MSTSKPKITLALPNNQNIDVRIGHGGAEASGDSATHDDSL
jgi:hypothetical protein